MSPVTPPPLRSLRHQPSLTQRAADDLRRAIQDGHYEQTGRLPAEPDLARQLGVSRATLRHAISVLQEEGLVTRRHGSGTFVAGRIAELRNNLNVNFGVTDLIDAAGWQPGFRGLEVEEGRAGHATSAQLDVPPRSRIMLVHRTRTADGRPVAFTTDMVPSHHLGDIGASPDELRRHIESVGSLYLILARLGLIVHHGVAEVKPAKADRRMSRSLEVPFGMLLLEFDQVDSTSDGDAILRSREWYLADAFRFHVYRKGSGGRL